MFRPAITALKRTHRSSDGFTLVEVLVYVSIVTLTMGIAGGSIFQSLSVEEGWRDSVIATKELRHAGSWFAGDALNAETTDLIDGAPPASSVRLAWTDGAGMLHQSTYTLLGSSLVRDFDNTQMAVARRVLSAGFSLSGRVVTFALEVEAEKGNSKSTTLLTYLRTSS